MKKILMSVLFCLTTSIVFCQEVAKNVFAELGGTGGLSFNYDTRFTPKRNGFGARIGVGKDIAIVVFNGVAASPSFLIPTQLNYLIGKDGKHYFEFGGGVTFVTKHFHPNGNVDDKYIYGNTFGNLDFAYRRQSSNGGFFFRAALDPLFAPGIFWPLQFGWSFGYTFKSSHR